MIGQLIGKPTPFTPGAILLQVRGVGYKVFVTPDTLSSISSSSRTKLFIYTHVRDDILNLYGFQTQAELQLFELIISVSGIGPKIAINLLDQGVPAIQQAVAKADVDFFTAIPRLGKKNAQKIIIELKPKLGDLQELDLTGATPETLETIDALISLGFTKKEARLALKDIDTDLPLETTITQAIRKLGKNR